MLINITYSHFQNLTLHSITTKKMSRINMDQAEPEEPTCVLKMLNEFNRVVPEPQGFPFAFERMPSVAPREPETKSIEKEPFNVKKRKVDANDSTLDSDRSINDSLSGL